MINIYRIYRAIYLFLRKAVFNDQMVQGYRGVNINSRHNEESLGELYRKDDIDVSNQEHTAPVYFQSLSLD